MPRKLSVESLPFSVKQGLLELYGEGKSLRELEAYTAEQGTRVDHVAIWRWLNSQKKLPKKHFVEGLVKRQIINENEALATLSNLLVPITASLESLVEEGKGRFPSGKLNIALRLTREIREILDAIERIRVKMPSKVPPPDEIIQVLARALEEANLTPEQIERVKEVWRAYYGDT